jgi:hypothetical protein
LPPLPNIAGLFVGYHSTIAAKEPIEEPGTAVLVFSLI